MKYFGNCCQVAREVAFRSFGYTFTTPRNQGIFGQTSVAVLDLDVRKLYAPVREFVHQIDQLALCSMLAGCPDRAYVVPTASSLYL